LACHRVVRSAILCLIGNGAHLDLVFWIGLGVGAILSLIASIVANIYDDKIQRTLDTFKLARKGKHRSTALKEYLLIRDLQQGVRDKYIHFLTLSTTSVLALICSVSFILFYLMFLIYDITPPRAILFGLIPPVSDTFVHDFVDVALLVCMLVSFFSAMTALKIMHKIIRRASALHNFKQFYATTRRQWNFTSQELDEDGTRRANEADFEAAAARPRNSK
jgi:hypothetical protein